MMTRSALIASAALLALGACDSNGAGGGDAAMPALSVVLADAGWNGTAVPPNQQCRKDGGEGNTPALSISGLPAGTTDVHVAFNDASYAPLSSGGGHGILGYKIGTSSSSVSVPSLAGEAAQVSAPGYVVKRNRATGAFAAPGYLPPCSGGKGNLYFADVSALDANGATLAEGRVDLGRY